MVSYTARWSVGLGIDLVDQAFADDTVLWTSLLSPSEGPQSGREM